ncbi:MAG TPA: CehA/McbA family metallohydrolase [Anaerolineae bacterium]|nr:CehA/McbA family metallohydrolase [Anaerolineae bacterium]HOQ98608.1 CehA/McbA family metallohydrolase [Anaerolineae bacterium]HPL28769.1 CehA/McbA family metallohydrolase [Anaerolineae bacterium]
MGTPCELTLPLHRWVDLRKTGWYGGNTHVHYDERETRPDERLELDTRVHDLSVMVISHLERRGIPYSSNKYRVGILAEFGSDSHVIDCGEETRHNRGLWEAGYGHLLLVGLQHAVEPLSRGLLVSDSAPDYPPLCRACDEARRQGGLAIWCHNGGGMEAPVAAALGKLDALNLFDPFWAMPEEYTVWYHLLNCGFHLPASTGSDWYVCSNNRVYVQVDGPFSYDAWLGGLRAGRSFITNGPALFVRVDGCRPGDVVRAGPDHDLETEVAWESCHAVERIELVLNGEVLSVREVSSGERHGLWRFPWRPQEDGWLAARLVSRVRDSYYQPVFAHTSPVWLHVGRPAAARAASAAFFVKSLDKVLQWVHACARFADEEQRAEVTDLFRSGQDEFRRLL